MNNRLLFISAYLLAFAGTTAQAMESDNSTNPPARQRRSRSPSLENDAADESSPAQPADNFEEAKKRIRSSYFEAQFLIENHHALSDEQLGREVYNTFHIMGCNIDAFVDEISTDEESGSENTSQKSEDSENENVTDEQ